MRRTPRGVGRCTGPATSVTSAPASARGARDREAHLAARQVGDAAHRVDRLEGRAGGDQHAACRAAPWAGRRRSARRAVPPARACGRRRSRRRPGRRLPGPSTVAPSARSCATLRCVAGCAHISRFIAGATSSGQRSIGRARHSRLSRSSARPCSELGDEVGAGRRDQHRVGLARQVDVRHVVRLARVPLARVHAAGSTAPAASPAVMNCSAAAVITTCTVAPALTSARVSSAAL